MEHKDSERTKRLKESKITDDFLGIKKGVRYGATKLSEGLDRLGFTGDKKKEEPVKKASKKFLNVAIEMQRGTS